MTPVFVVKLGLQTRHINVETQKINGSILNTFGIVLASFMVKDTLGRVWFF